tara:strand:- start:2232 stop:4229 length:1998 start_codon:yes stop_codon:yes gene_type:complete
MSGVIGTTNISLLSLRTSWGEVGYAGGSDPGSLNISLSEFRGAIFTTGSPIPSSGQISIEDDFRGRTFGSSPGIVYNTGSFKVYDNWSAYSTKLKGVSGASVYTGSSTANKRVQLDSGQSSAVPYPIILLTPNATNSSTSPGIIVDRSNSNAVDEVTVWFRVISHNTSGQVQMGIIAKDMTLNNWTSQKSNLTTKHATYMDRLGFHGYGFHNYAGSRDDITSLSTIVSPQYKTGTYGSYLTTNFHNRTGRTAGTMRSFNATAGPPSGTDMYFFKNSYANYNTYRSNSLNPSHGLKVKWYEKTLQVRLVSGSSDIVPTGAEWSTSELTGIFSGMYVSGTGIPANQGAFIGNIQTNKMVLYQGTGTGNTIPLVTLNASSSLDLSNVTITISGYLYWTLTTGSDSANSNTNYTNAKIFGPPHTVLPKYQAASSGSTTTQEIKEWAFYLGDTTSNRYNYFQYDLRSTDPTGTPFSYSVSYPSPEYEFASNPGGTYAISGSLSGISPLGSGYTDQDQTDTGVDWAVLSMGLHVKFLVAGQVVALGAQNRFGGKISIFLYSGGGALSTVDIAGTSSSLSPKDLTRNYKYTTLSTPLSVSANTEYVLGFTNSNGGYAYHGLAGDWNTNTTNNTMKLINSGSIQGGTHTTPLRPTSFTTAENYGATDLIFLPS